jgi:hypothetical protein
MGMSARNPKKAIMPDIPSTLSFQEAVAAATSGRSRSVWRSGEICRAPSRATGCVAFAMLLQGSPAHVFPNPLSRGQGRPTSPNRRIIGACDREGAHEDV